MPSPTRLSSIDLLRGIVMLLMTVDHSRDIFHTVTIHGFIPEDVSLGLFLTRWITHLCAPTFVFLAGVSFFLNEQKHPLEKEQLHFFLFKRGIFLIFLEFTQYLRQKLRCLGPLFNQLTPHIKLL